jgi:hypothetical protein
MYFTEDLTQVIPNVSLFKIAYDFDYDCDSCGNPRWVEDKLVDTFRSNGEIMVKGWIRCYCGHELNFQQSLVELHLKKKERRLGLRGVQSGMFSIKE